MFVRTLLVATLLAAVSQKTSGAAERKDVTLRVLFMLDKSVYDSWLSFAGNNEDDAFKTMNYFYSKVFTMARDQMRKESNEKVKYDLIFSNSTIDKTHQWFFANEILFNFGADVVFNKFREHLNFNEKHQNYDIAFWFTKNNYKFLSDKNDISNEYFISAVTTSVIVKEEGLYKTVNSVVSGIANSLLVQKSSCKSLKEDGELKSISGCLKKEMEDFIQRPLDYAYFYTPSPANTILDAFPCSEPPLLDLEKQCQLLYGSQSNRCIEDGKEDPCAELGCVKDQKCHYSLLNKAFYGTPCGCGGRCAFNRCNE